MNNKTKGLVFAAIIAAIYAVLTVFLSFMSFGAVQYRIAEGLTILPFYSPYAIPGLLIGCILSNILSPMGLLDLIFGSLATLLASVLTHLIGKSNIKYKKFLAPLPPVVCNGIIIGLLLKYAYKLPLPLWLLMLQVAFGELICCYGIGLPIMSLIEKNPVLNKLFLKNSTN